MSSIARAARTSEEIRAEIEQTFGFFPPFFEPALPAAQVLENLWQQTLSAYVQNPLSALFKERLNALLSRYCAAPYCMIVHSSALRPLGMTAQQVLALLDESPLDEGAALSLGSLPTPTPEEAAAPMPESLHEKTLLYCATAVFLEWAITPACQLELRRVLGGDLYLHLIAYLAYIKTCHTWIEAHPEVSHEADRRAIDNLGPLLAEEPALADFFGDYQARVRKQGLSRERRRADDEALKVAQARTAGILESITDAFFALDTEWRFTYLNEQAEQVIFQKSADVLGRVFWDVFPEAVGSTFEREYRRAIAEGVVVTFEEYFPPLASWYDVRVYPSLDGLSVFFQQVNERKRTQEERERGTQRERFLADLAARARVLADPDEVITDAVKSMGEFLGVSRCIFADINIEADTCAVHSSEYRADPSAVSIVGTVSIASFGAFVVAEYAARRAVIVDDVRTDPVRAPEGSLAAYEAIDIRAHVTVPVLHFDRVVSCMSVHSATPRHWAPEEVTLLQTVVEQTWLTVEVLRQQRASAREAETTARILASITDAFFTLDRDWRFIRINDQAERLMTRPRKEIMGLSFWEAFPSLIGTQFEQEYRRAVDEGVAVTFQRFYAPLDAWLDVRAYPFKDGLSVFFRDITQRKTAEAERERLLEQQQRRAERETLINRISQTIRSVSDPEAIQEAAVELLGEALGADRCYFALYDLGRSVVTIARDWHRTSLPSVQGVYSFENTAEMFQELYGGTNTSVVSDAHTAPLSAQTRANMERLQLRARVSVALMEGDSLMATLTAAMADGPREWTRDEVALVEAVGTQLRTAVETARVAQREHTIATQLQSALQPNLPKRVHDLSVGNYTRPALAEASVGGDFFDIFPLDKELYAIVIGDVSGKGLAAAQQLALIRNSLRTALYLYRAPAQVVAAINAIVSAHDLLVGFVTAWVGIYDTATGKITYASCGHEPGMVRRKGTGTVEMLLTTGPPLGLAENAVYEEEQVTLTLGDMLLLYTDGISEAGLNRRELLGTGGLTHLFAALPGGLGVQAAAEMLVAQVGDFAGGVFRDDVAVLLARRE